MMRDRCAWRGCEDPPSASSPSGYCPTHERASTIVIDRAAPAVLGPVRAQACKRCGFHVCECAPSPTFSKAREQLRRMQDACREQGERASRIAAEALRRAPEARRLCEIGQTKGATIVPAGSVPALPPDRTGMVQWAPMRDVDVLGLVIDDGGAGCELDYVQIGWQIVCPAVPAYGTREPIPLAVVDGSCLLRRSVVCGELVVIAVRNPTPGPVDVHAFLCVEAP